jgi:hypothetical protein
MAKGEESPICSLIYLNSRWLVKWHWRGLMGMINWEADVAFNFTYTVVTILSNFKSLHFID